MSPTLSVASPDEVYQVLYDAIANSVLRPGQKLSEETIARAFSVTRWAIRPVLNRLASDGVVTIIRHRGAFVALPPVGEAREVYSARRIIESGLVLQVEQLTEGEIDILNHHLECEDCARRDQDGKLQLRLAGEFHILLAEIAGNRLLCGVLRDLLAKTALTAARYQTSSNTSCRTGDHRALVALLQQGKQAAAARLMVKHLNAIENSLNLDSIEEPEPVLGATLEALRLRRS